MSVGQTVLPAVTLTVSPAQIKKKLDKVLGDKATFAKSAKASFRQFDLDNSGTLDLTEVKDLVTRLCVNLQLPPVDDATLETIFRKYDVEDKNQLTADAFAHLYLQILYRIRERYYPEKRVLVRREGFVHRVALEKRDGIRKLFKFNKKLGEGSFGEVHLVTERSSGLTRVCKVINREKTHLPAEQVEDEIRVLKSLDHPNIIKVFEVYEDPTQTMYIIMETCDGGELLERVVSAQKSGRLLSERYVAELMFQLMNALAYFHGKNVAHKDLKPENVLFQDKTPMSSIKVIDFGLAEMFKSANEISVKAAGTALYMAPEVFLRKIDLKCDVWSAGCIMYFLLTGELPFIGASVEDVRNRVLNKEPLYSVHCRHLSSSGCDLLRCMLTKDPKKRISSREAMRHEWFAGKHQVEAVPLPAPIVANMQAYIRNSALKNALINMVTHQLNVTGGQIKLISDVFCQLDRDGNGTLSPVELRESLMRAGIPQWDVNRIIQALDVDDSGSISYTEFVAACYTWHDSELNLVWTAFNKMAKPGQDKISVGDFIAALCGEGLPTKFGNSPETLKMVREMDVNGDGFIDWDEFARYVTCPLGLAAR